MGWPLYTIKDGHNKHNVYMCVLQIKLMLIQGEIINYSPARIYTNAPVLHEEYMIIDFLYDIDS